MGRCRRRPRGALGLSVGVDARPLLEPPGGLRRYAEGLLPELIRIAPGVDFRLFATRAPAQPWARATIVPGSPSALLRWWWEDHALPRALARAPVDVFFSPLGAVPALPCPAVATLHDLAFLEEPGLLPWHHAAYWRRVARRLPRAASVIAVSDATRDSALRRLALDPARVVAIPSGVDARFARAAPARIDALRARHGLPAEFVLAVGSWEPRKNLVLLAEAVSRAGRRLGRGVPLVVAGQPSPQQSGRFPQVRALGVVDDAELVALLSAATALALPSLHEGFGLPLVEAMACGTPCLASDVDALPEVAGGAALLLPPRDVDAWAAALVRILEEPALRADLGARGRARADAFSWERTARLTLAALEAAAPGR